MLSIYLQNKILRYNIHPIAEILKPFIKEYGILCVFSFYDFLLSHKNIKKYCYFCHDISHNNINILSRYLCDECYETSNPNDDIYIFTTDEIINFRRDYAFHCILQNKKFDDETLLTFSII